MSDLVGNPEDRFSCVAAQMIEHYFATIVTLNGIIIYSFVMVVAGVCMLFSLLVCVNWNNIFLPKLKVVLKS